MVRFQPGKKDEVGKNKMKNETDVKKCGEWLWWCRTEAMVRAQHPHNMSLSAELCCTAGFAEPEVEMLLVPGRWWNEESDSRGCRSSFASHSSFSRQSKHFSGKLTCLTLP